MVSRCPRPGSPGTWWDCWLAAIIAALCCAAAECRLLFHASGATRGVSAAMIAANQQSHQVPGEPGLGQRLTNAGYAYENAAENIYAFAKSVFHAHADRSRSPQDATNRLK